jgi:predicted DNA-binding transcriptional regulator AlpA
MNVTSGTDAARLAVSDRFLCLDEILHLSSMGRSQLLVAVKAGEFPQPRRLTTNGRRVAWLKSEVEAWIKSRPIASEGSH